jgi:hypothetical protein
VIDLNTMITDTIEYNLISNFYGNQVAKRSQVPLINHINEGLVVLDQIDTSDFAKQAFCIHPLLQNDDNLMTNCFTVANLCSTKVIMYAMEYRNIANAFLSDKIPAFQNSQIRLSPIPAVNHMLIADKVQNRKDFWTYHRGTHPRSNELEIYFDEWLDALGISEERYEELCMKIDVSKSMNNRISGKSL